MFVQVNVMHMLIFRTLEVAQPVTVVIQKIPIQLLYLHLSTILTALFKKQPTQHLYDLYTNLT